jgi:transcriptional regulator with GAF, ATPase, and Fis domain
MVDDESPHSAMAQLVNNAFAGADLEQFLAAITAASLRHMAGVNYADVMLITEGRLQSIAPTGPLVTELDAVQHRLQQGPCLQAALTDSVIRCPDLRQDSRWPQFAAAAVKFGVHSTLSFPLYTPPSGAGALNLLSCKVGGFDREAEAFGAMLATHASLALTAANTAHPFHSALARNDVISQATGIMMERFALDRAQAVEILTRLSRTSNKPVHSLAEQLVAGRQPIDVLCWATAAGLPSSHPSVQDIRAATQC